MGQTQQQLASEAFKRKEQILARWKDGPLADLLAGDARLARAAEWIVLRVCWSGKAEKRGEHALEILANAGSIARVTPHHHTVQSNSDASEIQRGAEAVQMVLRLSGLPAPEGPVQAHDGGDVPRGGQRRIRLEHA